MTDEELKSIANKVATIMQADATSLDTLPKVDSLSGVYSLPALQGSRLVEVALSLLRGVDGKNSRVYVSESGIVSQMGDDAPVLLVSNEKLKEWAQLTVTEVARAAAEAAEQFVTAAEASRVAAENSRATEELSRVAAEKKRVASEVSRASAEASRVSAEKVRASEESKRSTAEQSREASEASRASVEESRVAAEKARKEEESKRGASEVSRTSAEASRVEAESSRVTAETSREQAKVEMQAATVEANTAAGNASTKAADAKAAAEAARQAAKLAEDIAVGKISKELVENALTGEITTHTHPIATVNSSGYMDSSDKKKLDGLNWDSLEGKPTEFNPSAHSHTASEITDFQAKVNEYAPTTDLSAYETAAQILKKYALKQHAHTVEEITDLLQSLANNLAAANEYTDTKISETIGTAPEALDSIQELANAIGDDPNFSVTVANMVAEKLDKSVFELFKQSATSKITNLESHFTNDKRTITEEEATQISKIANIEAQLSGLDSALNNLNNL